MDSDAPLPRSMPAPRSLGHHAPPAGTTPLRTVAWRGHDDIALVLPAAGPIPPEVAAIAATIDAARRRGVNRLVTGALTELESIPFVAAGFSVHDELHLLRHELADLPDPRPVDARMRRARPKDVERALTVDARAFAPFWRLDRRGLEDAVAATTSSRFRVAYDSSGVVGYAVTGRSAGRGYLQRLAVDPERWRSGIGAALVLDGLRWLHRWRCHSAVVNTQVGNEGALALYRRIGFVPQPSGLTVMTIALADPR